MLNFQRQQRKRVKIFTFLILTLVYTKIQSQSPYSLECGFIGENLQLPAGGNFSCSTDPAFLDSFDPVVFRIHFWQINDSNGNTTPEGVLTENLILETVAKLNIEYNQYKIFFKYTGFTSFDSPPNVVLREYNQEQECYNTNQIDTDGYSVLHHCQVDEMIDYIENNNIFDPNAFNV